MPDYTRYATGSLKGAYELAKKQKRTNARIEIAQELAKRRVHLTTPFDITTAPQWEVNLLGTKRLNDLHRHWVNTALMATDPHYVDRALKVIEKIQTAISAHISTKTLSNGGYVPTTAPLYATVKKGEVIGRIATPNSERIITQLPASRIEQMEKDIADLKKLIEEREENINKLAALLDERTLISREKLVESLQKTFEQHIERANTPKKAVPPTAPFAPELSKVWSMELKDVVFNEEKAPKYPLLSALLNSKGASVYPGKDGGNYSITMPRDKKPFTELDEERLRLYQVKNLGTDISMFIGVGHVELRASKHSLIPLLKELQS